MCRCLTAIRSDPALDATLREWARLAGGLPLPRAVWAMFAASILLGLAGAPQAWPHEAPAMWAAAWLPPFLFLRWLASRAGVLGMRDPVPGAQ